MPRVSSNQTVSARRSMRRSNAMIEASDPPFGVRPCFVGAAVHPHRSRRRRIRHLGQSRRDHRRRRERFTLGEWTRRPGPRHQPEAVGPGHVRSRPFDRRGRTPAARCRRTPGTGLGRYRPLTFSPNSLTTVLCAQRPENGAVGAQNEGGGRPRGVKHRGSGGSRNRSTNLDHEERRPS